MNSFDQSVREISTHFRGCVKVHLKYLDFPLTLFGSKVFDTKKVDKLERYFSQHQLARLDPRNHISAVISKELLEQARRDSGISGHTNAGDPPLLSLPNGCQLECIYGKHRIKAVSELLYPDNRWWIVSLYDDSKLPRSN